MPIDPNAPIHGLVFVAGLNGDKVESTASLNTYNLEEMCLVISALKLFYDSLMRTAPRDYNVSPDTFRTVIEKMSKPHVEDVGHMNTRLKRLDE